MTTVSLPLPANALYDHPQQLEFDKIATFIGGNGSGKSSILKSIFDEKLKLDSSLYENYKVVCFSSGQNESYSDRFAHYLNTERANKRALSLDCFYYDKSLAKLLIFLSTTSDHNGLVRTFLRQNNYVVESEFDEDESTELFFDVIYFLEAIYPKINATKNKTTKLPSIGKPGGGGGVGGGGVESAA